MLPEHQLAVDILRGAARRLLDYGWTVGKYGNDGGGTHCAVGALGWEARSKEHLKGEGALLPHNASELLTNATQIAYRQLRSWAYEFSGASSIEKWNDAQCSVQSIIYGLEQCALQIEQGRVSEDSLPHLRQDSSSGFIYITLDLAKAEALLLASEEAVSFVFNEKAAFIVEEEFAKALTEGRVWPGGAALVRLEAEKAVPRKAAPLALPPPLPIAAKRTQQESEALETA